MRKRYNEYLSFLHSFLIPDCAILLSFARSFFEVAALLHYAYSVNDAKNEKPSMSSYFIRNCFIRNEYEAG